MRTATRRRRLPAQAVRSAPRREGPRWPSPPNQVTPSVTTVLSCFCKGGALGSYQGGVYQALAEASLYPDWVAGISIPNDTTTALAHRHGDVPPWSDPPRYHGHAWGDHP